MTALATAQPRAIGTQHRRQLKDVSTRRDSHRGRRGLHTTMWECVRAVANLLRRLPRSSQLVGNLIYVLLLGLALLVASGSTRGNVDWLAATTVRWLEDWVQNSLADGWMAPTVAHAVVGVLTFLAFALLMLALAAATRRLIPCYIEAIVIAEWLRRTGNRLATFGLLVAVSLPMALMLALACKGVMSLLATGYFVLGVATISLATDRRRLNSTIDRIVTIRTAFGNPDARGSDTHADQAEDG